MTAIHLVNNDENDGYTDMTQTTLATIPTDLLTLDFDTSTVTIAGHRYPACGGIVPAAPDDTDPRHMRYTVGPARYPNDVKTPDSRGDFYVPCENGALVEVGWYTGRDGRDALEVHLFSRNCHLREYPGESDIWLPVHLGIFQHRLVNAEPVRTSAAWRWDGCDPEWVAELIDRVATMPVERVVGPEMEIVGLAELWDLVAQGHHPS